MYILFSFFSQMAIMLGTCTLDDRDDKRDTSRQVPSMQVRCEQGIAPHDLVFRCCCCWRFLASFFSSSCPATAPTPIPARCDAMSSMWLLENSADRFSARISPMKPRPWMPLYGSGGRPRILKASNRCSQK
ncbi:hypothetical protein VTK73DRAFT_4965 [Phialemonium thermophilum]|uniref:Secreted protein n=1 Tax=Phialemonium thermophilum TaxID=223376 RepID=A0ABR3V4V6_9PEZI